MAHFKIYKKNSTWRVSMDISKHTTKDKALKSLVKHMLADAKYLNDSSSYDVYRSNGEHEYSGVFNKDLNNG